MRVKLFVGNKTMSLSADSVVIFCCLVFGKFLFVSAEKIRFPDRLDIDSSEIDVADETKDSSDMSEPLSSSEDSYEIPLDVLQKLDNIRSMDEFYRTFGMPQQKIPVVSAGIGSSLYGLLSKFKASSLFAGRNGSPSDTNSGEHLSAQSVLVERNAVVAQPEFGSCEPEMRAEEIYKSPSRQVKGLPSCIRIEKCGGCCSNELFSCQPTLEENFNVTVNKFLFNKGGYYTQIGNESVPVTRHLKCECKCKAKKKDCKGLQVYMPGSCKCMCKNIDAREKCKKESEKRWDPETCTCDCKKKNTTECSTGQFFSNLTCSCQSIHSTGTEVQLASNDRNNNDYYYNSDQN